MTKMKIYLLVITTMLLACKSNSNLIGNYSSEYDVSLELAKDKTFLLSMPRSVLELDQEAIKISGNYNVVGENLILDSQLTNEKSYTIEVPPQTSSNEYEFMVKGKDWGRLEGVRCQIKVEGNVVQESISDQMGIAKFKYTNTGNLVIEHNDWENIDLSLEKLTHKALIITLEKKDYLKRLNDYELLISDKSLTGRKEIKHWELNKEAR